MPSWRRRELGVSSGRGFDMISCVAKVAKTVLCQRWLSGLSIILSIRYRAVQQVGEASQTASRWRDKRSFGMENAVNRVLSAFLLCVPVYTFSSGIARGDDWGCQVLLCLSNPGGATQYAKCRPPIERLWSHLAKGRSFPICSGVGFTATTPRYEPYYCDAGFQLVSRSNDARHGRSEEHTSELQSLMRISYAVF